MSLPQGGYRGDALTAPARAAACSSQEGPGAANVRGRRPAGKHRHGAYRLRQLGSAAHSRCWISSICRLSATWVSRIGFWFRFTDSS